MEAKFKVGDAVVIKNHPNKELIGQEALIANASLYERKTICEYEYEIFIDKRRVGWSLEHELELSLDKKDQASELILSLLQSSDPLTKVNIALYALILLSEESVNINSDKTTLSSDYIHKNGKKYRAEMVITQQEISK